MSVQAGEEYRFEQEVWFDGHQYGFPKAGQVLITRGSDGFTWNGSAFVSGTNWQATTIDGSNLFHYYDWTVPVAASDGDTFILKIRLQGDPDTESGGTMVVREEGSGGGDTFVFPINVFDD